MGGLVFTILVCGSAFLALTFIIYRVITRVIFPEIAHREGDLSHDAIARAGDVHQANVFHARPNTEPGA